MTPKINKRDYQIIINFDNSDQLIWSMKRKSEPYAPCTREEWHLVLDAASEIKEKVQRYIIDYEQE